MSPALKSPVVIVSLQVQTSFQAVPLGAASVVSALRSDTELSRLLDVKLAEFSLEDDDLAGRSAERAGQLIAKKIAALNPRVAGFSVYVWNRVVLEAAARELKRLVPDVVTFAGGPEVTADIASFSVSAAIPTGRYSDSEPANSFDHLLSGEGESLSVSLVRSIVSGAKLPEEIAAHERAKSENCAVLPSPWLDGTLDSSIAVRECRGALWELARGCPYKCAYCYESRGDKKVRAFPIERLEKELERFVSLGIERVFVLDPTYNASRERALSLLKLIEKKAPELHFNFEARAEHLDRELVAAFAKIPCSLQIGLQSSNPEALKLVNRPCDLKDFSRKIGLLNDAGIVFGLDLMYGLPGDTLSTFRTSLDYAVGLYPNNIEIFRLAVLPGTDLADRAAELSLKHDAKPPYLEESTPKFPAQDLERAGLLARACDVFYTQGRAVTWFLSMLHPLKLKPSQFFQDFADYLADPATIKAHPALASRACEFSQAEAESLQVSFAQKKFKEKGKAFLVPAVCDIIRLNGAWTRALAEGEETELALSYHPEDLFSPDSMDPEYFVENAYMENCTVRVFAGADGPDMEIL